MGSLRSVFDEFPDASAGTHMLLIGADLTGIDEWLIGFRPNETLNLNPRT